MIQDYCYNHGQMRDRTLLFAAASLVLFLLAMYLPAVSVHTYCENRALGVVFAIGEVALLFGWFIWNRAPNIGKKVVAGVCEFLCLAGLITNVRFVIFATHLCRHMFDQLH